MAANTNPIYGRRPNNQITGSIIGSAANTSLEGTGSNITQIFVADATEGSFVDYVYFKPIGTIVATVARLWICTNTGVFVPGTTNTTVNTSLFAELSIAAWAASNTTASPRYEIPVKIAMNPSTKLLMTFGTSTGGASTGFNPITIATDY